MRPFLLGLGAGIIGVFAGAAYQGTAFAQSSAGATAEASAAMLTVALTTGGPAYFLFNQKLGAVGALAGALSGWIAYGMGRGLFNFFYSHEMWWAMEMAADLALAVPVAMLAGIFAPLATTGTIPANGSARRWSSAV